MNVFCERVDNCTVVTVEGDLAVPDSDRFRDFLMQRVETGSCELLLDFSEVPYIDSSGISTLLVLLQAARRQGGDIRLVGVNDRIQELFKQVGLKHVFRGFDTRDEGIASFTAVRSVDNTD
jgi:anti-sigma B factor antagonist